VTPPPRFPQPPEKALAVPTIDLSKKVVVQALEENGEKKDGQSAFKGMRGDSFGGTLYRAQTLPTELVRMYHLESR